MGERRGLPGVGPDEPLDTISFGGERPSAKVLAMLKRYGFRLEPDGIHWSRVSKGNVAAESDLIMEAMSDEYFGTSDDD
jgi:hypothetical protein